MDERRDTLRRMTASVFVYVLLGGFSGAAAQLPSDIMLDSYLLRAEQAARDGDLAGARAAINKIISLQNEHELNLTDDFHFRYAKAADAADLPERALESVVRYLAAAGREGQHYVEALELGVENPTESQKPVETSYLRAHGDSRSGEVERSPNRTVEAVRGDPGGGKGPLSRDFGSLLAGFHLPPRTAVPEAFLTRRIGVVHLLRLVEEDPA